MLLPGALHCLHLFIRQLMKPIRQPIDLAVGGVDRVLDHLLVLHRLDLGQLLLQSQHPLDQLHHLVMLGLIIGI
ncbi:MAG: hypothetical protein M1305_07715 [Candidatus Marsarchaeota archaeon]|nr:hypothetical protein [Candidatus Marsarchaeota archaeon]